METKLFLLLMLAISLNVKAQLVELPRNPETNKVSFYEVVQLDSTFSKEDLYINAKDWFFETFVNIKAVIHIDDKENGKISGKSFVSLSTVGKVFVTVYGDYNFTITIAVKNGKYRYEITDFSDAQETAIEDIYSVEPSKYKFYNGAFSELINSMKGLISSLKLTMNKTTGVTNNNW